MIPDGLVGMDWEVGFAKCPENGPGKFSRKALRTRLHRSCERNELIRFCFHYSLVYEPVPADAAGASIPLAGEVHHEPPDARME